MKWTAATPTEPGYYWVRNVRRDGLRYSQRIERVYKSRLDGKLKINLYSVENERGRIEFAGPISIPQPEPEEDKPCAQSI